MLTEPYRRLEGEKYVIGQPEMDSWERRELLEKPYYYYLIYHIKVVNLADNLKFK